MHCRAPILYRIIPNKGAPHSLPKTKSTKNDKSLYNSLNNCPIFNPKPPLESSEPQFQPCIIIFELVIASAPLLGIIRYILYTVHYWILILLLICHLGKVHDLVAPYKVGDLPLDGEGNLIMARLPATGDNEATFGKKLKNNGQ